MRLLLSFFLLTSGTLTLASTTPIPDSQPPRDGKDGLEASIRTSIPCEHAPALHVTFSDAMFSLKHVEPAIKDIDQKAQQTFTLEREPEPEQSMERLKIKRQYRPAYWFNPCKSPASIDTPGLHCEGGSFQDSITKDNGWFEDDKSGSFTKWKWGPWKDGEWTKAEKIRYGYYGVTQICHRTRLSRWVCWYDYGGFTSYSWYQ